MSISDKTRKLLWGKSGNKCAICKNNLIIGSTEKDDDSVIGEECHIHSSKSYGPRFDIDYPLEKIDNYNNLILLCRIHHKMIDDQFETYSSDILKKIKKNHEDWVFKRLDGSYEKKQPIKIKRLENNIPRYLQKISSGKELVNLMQDACGFYYDYDDMVSQEESGVIIYFLQLVQDFLDIQDNFEVGERVQVAFDLDKEIKEIEKAGLFIFGAKENQIIEGGVSPPDNWPIFHVQIIKQTNPNIIDKNKTKID